MNVNFKKIVIKWPIPEIFESNGTPAKWITEKLEYLGTNLLKIKQEVYIFGCDFCLIYRK